MKTYLLLFVFLCTVTFAYGQDPRERLYNYPVLKPNHAPKPKVEGWAQMRITENLNRGLVALNLPDGIYLSWRLLESDPENVTFNVYEEKTDSKPQKINTDPISATTDFFIKEAASAGTYFIKAVANGKELSTSEKVSAGSKSKLPYKSIPFQGEYSPDRVAVGDLNGDGEYDFVIKQPGGRVDPGVWRKSPDTFKLEAYLSDGTFLWRKDLGWNIELGIWYSPFIVYDFNGDGKAEVAVKTAPVDADYRDEDGRVFSGPEYCSVLDGMTGTEIDRVDWPERNGRFGRYNRTNRNQLGMAYLDGKTPSLLVARGTYRLMMVDAYQLNGNKLEKLWRWDGDEENPVIRSQGAHNLHTVDVDNDGRDEIVLGSAVVDDDGTLLFSAGVGHPDKCFVSDIDPNRPGMEIFFANEVWHDSAGVSMVDAATGQQIWNINHYTRHVGDGMVADILPEVPGLECFATEDSKAGLRDKYMLSSNGEYLARNMGVPQCRNWIFWDADKLRESIEIDARSKNMSRYEARDFSILKYPADTIQNGIEGSIMMMADLYGDWREELVTVLPGELRIYSTPLKAKDRRICLMQDHLYRSDVVHRSMGYFQSPLTSYYLGE
ncbi:silent information regulator protein Sir2 [Prolixibacteraceae bacterium Z1-6]|uniref:Silent information regulator protein Sir2 n=1 Tax=Draconibacterium aestuarii TaxID=2998507 RepID=A0A9X3F9K2_9BACT|nr:silent information regulator protein Sir2 [Prolixibacteraceae bacterium Z1-6]